MTIEDIYTTEIRRQSGKYYAAWVPEAQFKLGDYGLLKGALFFYQGNVSDHLGIAIKVQPGTAQATNQWSTSGATTTALSPQATVAGNPAVKVAAKLDIEFSSRKAMFFNAADCRSDRIDDMSALEKALIEKMKAGLWRQNWAVVTEIVRSQATIVLVSGGKSAKASLEANASVPKIDLADAGIKLGFTSEKALGHKTLAYKELTPLMELRGIATGSWWHPEDPHLDPRMAATKGAVAVLEKASESNPRLVRL
jgi:hypothetical protein